MYFFVVIFAFAAVEAARRRTEVSVSGPVVEAARMHNPTRTEGQLGKLTSVCM